QPERGRSWAPRIVAPATRFRGSSHACRERLSMKSGHLSVAMTRDEFLQLESIERALDGLRELAELAAAGKPSAWPGRTGTYALGAGFEDRWDVLGDIRERLAGGALAEVGAA